MEKKIFADENSKEEFKSLCVAVLPQIKAIMRTMKEKDVEASSSISLGADGYLNFHVYGSRWEMTKCGDDKAATIRYGYSEEIEAPEDQGMEYSKVAENLVEISLVFASLQAKHEELSEINSITCKQKFVDWANEFESQWNDDEGRDYQEEIDSFARKKILEYLKEVIT